MSECQTPFKPGQKLVSIFWDIENCGIPSGFSAFAVAQHIRNEVIVKNEWKEIGFSVYINAIKMPHRLQEDLTHASVRIVHVASLKADSADRAIMLDMDRLERTVHFLEHGHMPIGHMPVVFVLISGDIDFITKLGDLRNQAGFEVMLIHNETASEHLKAVANVAIPWRDLSHATPTPNTEVQAPSSLAGSYACAHAECLKSFPSFDDLVDHQIHHFHMVNATCTKCNQGPFESQDALRKHIVKAHQDASQVHLNCVLSLTRAGDDQRQQQQNAAEEGRGSREDARLTPQTKRLRDQKSPSRLCTPPARVASPLHVLKSSAGPETPATMSSSAAAVTPRPSSALSDAILSVTPLTVHFPLDSHSVQPPSRAHAQTPTRAEPPTSLGRGSSGVGAPSSQLSVPSSPGRLGPVSCRVTPRGSPPRKIRALSEASTVQACQARSPTPAHSAPHPALPPHCSPARCLSASLPAHSSTPALWGPVPACMTAQPRPSSALIRTAPSARPGARAPIRVIGSDMDISFITGVPDDGESSEEEGPGAAEREHDRGGRERMGSTKGRSGRGSPPGQVRRSPPSQVRSSPPGQARRSPAKREPTGSAHGYPARGCVPSPGSAGGEPRKRKRVPGPKENQQPPANELQVVDLT